MNTAASTMPQQREFHRAWRLAAIAMVSVRFVQGWIYWGGGSRRFIYAPSKLDPHAAHWMAYKFQSAMPGAILGMGYVVDWLLRHFVPLYASVILFSAVELVAGLMLITGTLTRLAALVSVGLAFVLMLLFGWQGATCIDEWTMASCNFAMGITLVLAGGGAWSVDGWLARRSPRLAESRWFQWLGGASSLPIGDESFKKLAGALVAVTVIFVVGTYHYYRGSVVTPFHSGPVSPTKHHWSLSEGRLTPAGQVSFSAYIDAGTPEAPSFIVGAVLRDAQGNAVESWNAAALAALPPQAFHNVYPYLKIHAGPFGLIGPIASKASVTLPPQAAGLQLGAGPYSLTLKSVEGQTWTLAMPAAAG